MFIKHFSANTNSHNLHNITLDYPEVYKVSAYIQHNIYLP